MAYIYNKPDASDAISASQSVLKDNFTAIKSFVDVNHVTFGLSNEGKHNTVSIPEITVTPGSIPIATSAIEWAMYSASDGTSTQLWLRNNNAAGTVTGDIPFTKANKASPGECYLPCGIRLKWGTGTINGGSSTSTGSFVGTALNTLLNMQMAINSTYSSSYDNRDYHLAISGTTSTWTVARSSYNGATISFYYLAIGY